MNGDFLNFAISGRRLIYMVVVAIWGNFRNCSFPVHSMAIRIDTDLTAWGNWGNFQIVIFPLEFSGSEDRLNNGHASGFFEDSEN